MNSLQPLNSVVFKTGKGQLAILVVLLIVLTVVFSTSSTPLSVVAAPIDSWVINPSAKWSEDDADDTYSIAWGDVDLDGDLDLVVGNYDTSNKLYLNEDGVLQTTAVWSSYEKDHTASVKWGDVDGDSYLDLAVGNVGEPNRVYLNMSGSLETTASWTSGDSDQTYSVDWGDVNGDGNLDLAAGNEGQPNKIYFNTGTALEKNASQELGIDEQTRSVAWGDMNGDGRLDLAVGNVVNDPDSVYLNSGRKLQNTPSWNSGGGTLNLAWGDMNGDGRLDLAATSFGAVVVYLNIGSTLQTARDNPWSSGQFASVSIAWGDMDNDGDLDLATANTSAGSVSTERNTIYINKNGTLQPNDLWYSSEADWSNSVAWGDVDGDGDLDLAVGNFRSNKLYMNEGLHLDSTNKSASPIVDEDWSYSVAWGDVDGDSDQDLAVGNIVGEKGGFNKLYINKNGSLQTTASWRSNDSLETRSVAWGDFDGDDDLDLAAGNWNDANRLYLNDDGNLAKEAIWQSQEKDATSSVAWGDVDGDGDLDLAVGDYGDANKVYLNDGDQLLTKADWSSNDNDPTTSVAWGDVDRDGDLDLAVGNEGKANKVYFNNGGRLRADADWVSEDNDPTTSIAWGDLDGDGYLDLAAGNLHRPNKVYLNEKGVLQTEADHPWNSGDDAGTVSTAWTDYDSDGDLDLVFANWDEPDVIHLNHDKILQPKSETKPDSARFTEAMAWADLDGDGDLDAALGNEGLGGGTGNWNTIIVNMRRQWIPAWDNPVHIRLERPGNTDDAAFFSSPEIIQANNVTINYVLSDREEDNVTSILPQYSPNGGGQWFTATPGKGGDGLTDLRASPLGTNHTFVWHAEKDLIKSDNVVFRISAIPGRKQSPVHWPAQSAQTPPFRVEAAPWFAKVIDENDQAVNGALLYHEGVLVEGLTDLAGLLRLDEPAEGDRLVALQEVWRQPTTRQEHNEWAYRVYLTNLNLDDNGVPHPDTINERERKQLVTLSRDNTLILFNILVSVEWDADAAYLNNLSEAFEKASAYLYDVSDGQMAFGEVHIFDRGEHWADADFQISTKNTVRPYAYVGGILSEDTAHAIRVGRFWDGGSGNVGEWNQDAGFRTLIHEFGHYALHLYDEYFMREADAQGHFIGQRSSACTDLDFTSPDIEEKPTNASIMYYQYKASELADDDRWFTPCKNTEQQRVNGGSDWSTIVQVLGDKNNPPRWIIRTPTSRGSVMSGPEPPFPSDLMPLPKITIDAKSMEGESKRDVTVLDHAGASFPNALVALYTTPEEYTIAIDQGLTDQFGELDVYGAVEGDTIQAASLDGAYAGAAIVDENPIQITLEQTGPSVLQYAGGFSTPYLNLVPKSDGDSLVLEVHGAPQGSKPLNAIIIPGQGAGSPQSTSLAYSSSQDAYTGGVSFTGVGLGSGEVRVSGTPGGQWVSINTNYNLLRAGNNQSNELASEDGNLQLYVDPGSLPSKTAYATVLPTGYVPAPLPDGKQVLASAYNVRFSGSMTSFEKPALLKLIYHPDVVGPAEDLTIYFWNAAEKHWQVMGGEANEVENGLTVPITQLGIYVLGGKVEFVPARILLPVISNNSLGT